MAFPVTGGITSMQVALGPLRDASGAIVGMVGVGRDMSQLHDVEREREEAKSHDWLSEESATMWPEEGGESQRGACE